MPKRINVAIVDKTLGPFKILGRVEVTGPFYGGTSERPEDDRTAYKARALAERIERAIASAIVNFRSDFGIDADIT